MTRKYRVESAGGVARRLVEEMGDFDQSLSGLTRLVRRFAAIEFEVPELPDADGYLFQYGKVNWFRDPTFVLGLVRQLEVVDAAGGHESYVQVQFELRYPLDSDLNSVGNHSEWWFPGDGLSFDNWLDAVGRSGIAERLAERSPVDFEIRQDLV